MEKEPLKVTPLKEKVIRTVKLLIYLFFSSFKKAPSKS